MEQTEIKQSSNYFNYINSAIHNESENMTFDYLSFNFLAPINVSLPITNEF